MVLWKHELKMNRKSLFIWASCIGFLCFGCILLFESLAETMGQVSEAYAKMGIFSAALGLDRLSISTMKGFYATEIALIFAVGGAMFAAMTGASMLSKEEEGHTSEFLNTLPVKRGHLVFLKYLAMITLIVLLQIICIAWELMGFFLAGEMPGMREYWLFHGVQLFMQTEVGSVCFLISSINSRKQMGASLGLAILLYMMDLLCRMLPDIENLKYVTPYYFSNAADIFMSGEINRGMLGISIGITAVTALGAAAVYIRKDLKA